MSGLDIESFGDRTFRIVATPAGYGARAFDVAGFLADLSREAKERDVRERVWMSLACHSVTRAGERLETRLLGLGEEVGEPAVGQRDTLDVGADLDSLLVGECHRASVPFALCTMVWLASSGCISSSPR